MSSPYRTRPAPDETRREAAPYALAFRDGLVLLVTSALSLIGARLVTRAHFGFALMMMFASFTGIIVGALVIYYHRPGARRKR